MWIPKTAAEIEQLVSSGKMFESEVLDAKERVSGDNLEIAKDIAAMSTNGGVIIYGVGEDERKRLNRLTPIQLDGVQDRIEAVARSNISEPPYISVKVFPAQEDASTGYIVVVVPASARAPHMVIGRDDNRYYKRTHHGNTMMVETEVAQLYERRERWSINRQHLLDQTIGSAPVTPQEGIVQMHLVAKPTVSDEGLLDRARKDRPFGNLFQDLLKELPQNDLFAQHLNPEFVPIRTWERTMHGWRVHFGEDPQRDTTQPPSQNVLDMAVQLDGTVTVFCNTFSNVYDKRFRVFEAVIAAVTERSLVFFGSLYREASYAGTIDLAFALTGTKGAMSATLLHNRMLQYSARPVEVSEYRRDSRVTAAELQENVRGVAEGLVMPFVNALTVDRFKSFENLIAAQPR